MFNVDIYQSVNYFFLPGKSTHNQRIKRLWRDVFAECISLSHGSGQF